MQFPAGIRPTPSIERLLARDVLDPVLAITAALAFVVVAHGERAAVWTVLGVALPIALIRRWPLAVLALVSLTTVATSGDGGWLDVAVFFSAAVSVGDGTRRTEPSIALVVLDAVLMGAGFIAEDAEAWAILVPLVLAVTGWLIGDAVRTGRLEAVARLEAEASRTRERDAALREVAREERRHMARELHDIIAHSVSVMVIQAGAARQVVTSDPARATESILAIESTGREAMTELRRIVGVLGDAGDEVELAPQPGVGQIGALVDRVVEAGLPVELRIEGDARPLSPTVDVTVYRIVQEGLTNALKYAGRARTLVALEFRDTDIKVEISDEGPGGTATPDGSPPGRGLAGMRERASSCGGRLEAGPRLGGGFAVRAWLPTATRP